MCCPSVGQLVGGRSVHQRSIPFIFFDQAIFYSHAPWAEKNSKILQFLLIFFAEVSKEGHKCFTNINCSIQDVVWHLCHCIFGLKWGLLFYDWIAVKLSGDTETLTFSILSCWYFAVNPVLLFPPCIFLFMKFFSLSTMNLSNCIRGCLFAVSRYYICGWRLCVLVWTS